MEKKNGVSFIVLILLLIVFACLGWFANSFYSSLDKNNSNKDNKKDEEAVDGGVVKLDINSSLVQLLYNEVTNDVESPSWYFNQKIYTHEYATEKDFVVKDASETLKMHVVGNILLNRESSWAPSAPDRSDAGRHAISSGREYEHYYTKAQVEDIYHQLYGREAKLDTSVIIATGHFDLQKYAYDSSSNKYYAYFGDGGGTTGPGGYTAKLDRGIMANDTITLYQKVKKFDGEDGTNLAEEFELVYTFNVENDDYIFVSKVKKTD